MLVAGGTGVVGSGVVQALLKQGAKVSFAIFSCFNLGEGGGRERERGGGELCACMEVWKVDRSSHFFLELLFNVNIEL